jgi:hypothetical protein
MKGVFVLLFISVVSSKAMAQTTIVRKGTMKVRKAPEKQEIKAAFESLEYGDLWF